MREDDLLLIFGLIAPFYLPRLSSFLRLLVGKPISDGLFDLVVSSVFAANNAEDTCSSKE